MRSGMGCVVGGVRGTSAAAGHARYGAALRGMPELQHGRLRPPPGRRQAAHRDRLDMRPGNAASRGAPALGRPRQAAARPPAIASVPRPPHTPGRRTCLWCTQARGGHLAQARDPGRRAREGTAVGGSGGLAAQSACADSCQTQGGQSGLGPPWPAHSQRPPRAPPHARYKSGPAPRPPTTSPAHARLPRRPNFRPATLGVPPRPATSLGVPPHRRLRPPARPHQSDPPHLRAQPRLG